MTFDVPPQSHMQRSPSERTLVDSESAPLLAKDADEISTAKRASRSTPLPMGQLLALCVTRLSDPISFTHIFPYVNEMMERLHVTNDPTKIGYYSGLVESIFAVAQLCSTYQWAHLSDRIGRKPVLLAGTLGGGIAGLLFGWSKTLPMLLFARCLAGLFSGTLTVGNTVLGDLTDSTNQAVAFPIYGLVWPLGAIIGPLLGGSFANPATQYPALFDNEFWRDRPYFLPGAIAALVSLLSVVYGWFALRETMPAKVVAALPTITLSRSPSTYGGTDNAELTKVVVVTPAAVAPTARTLLADALVRTLCLSGAALTLLATSYEVVFVLFCFSPIAAGGLALPTAQIGYGLAIAGASAAAIQLLAMPYLLRALDAGTLYALTLAAWPAAFGVLPAAHWLSESGFSAVAVWTLIATSLCLSRLGCMAYSAHMILVKDAAPTKAALGRTNGLAQVFHTSARALAPSLVSALFAMSSAQGGIARYAWAAAMVALCCVACRGASSIMTLRARPARF